MLLNCGVGKDSWESLGLQGDQTSQILKEISPEYSLEGLMLKLQSFGHLMWRTDSLEKTAILGKIEGKERMGQQRMRWLDASPTGRTWVWAISWAISWVDDGQGSLACYNAWGLKESDMTEQLNWTEKYTKKE